MDNKDKVLLEKILKEIDFLLEYVAIIDYEFFLQSEEKKRTISMTLINIGEKAYHLSKNFRINNQDIPIQNAIGLRNVAAHGYDTLKPRSIWNTVTRDIPELRSKILNILLNSQPHE